MMAQEMVDADVTRGVRNVMTAVQTLNQHAVST